MILSKDVFGNYVIQNLLEFGSFNKLTINF